MGMSCFCSRAYVTTIHEHGTKEGAQIGKWNMELGELPTEEEPVWSFLWRRQDVGGTKEGGGMQKYGEQWARLQQGQVRRGHATCFSRKSSHTQYAHYPGIQVSGGTKKEGLAIKIPSCKAENVFNGTT